MGTKTSLNKPFPRSYWVEEGKLLAGFYPGSKDWRTTLKNISGLVSCGIRCFVNLMEPGEIDYSGEYFEPYEPILNQVVEDTGLKLDYYSFPIKDVNIPSVEQMRDIIQTLDHSIHTLNKPVYVHCRGGIGRTGIVVGCWLIHNQKADSSNVIQLIEIMRKEDVAKHCKSPETPEQIEFVLNWK